jgi:thioredoxin-related protein
MRKYGLFLGVGLWILLGMLTLIGNPVWAKDFPSDWLANQAGYNTALEQQDATGKPILLYFHAPWCPYCTQLNDKLLFTPPVKDYLKDYINVYVYPTADSPEQTMAQDYGVRGYPTLFLIPKKGANPLPVSPHVGRNLMQPQQFINTLKVLGQMPSH